MSHMLVLGACLRYAKGQIGKTWHFWEIKHAQEKQQLEGNTSRTHERKACIRKAIAGRKNSTHAWEEDLKMVVLGFW
jgi:hypothetical protein